MKGATVYARLLQELTPLDPRIQLSPAEMAADIMILMANGLIVWEDIVELHARAPITERPWSRNVEHCERTLLVLCRSIGQHATDPDFSAVKATLVAHLFVIRPLSPQILCVYYRAWDRLLEHKLHEPCHEA